MKKLFIFCLLISLNSIVNAQVENIPERKVQKGFAKIDFLSIDMPITNIPNEKNMGFSGIHYNILLNDWAYTGVGIYGSISGSRGGFFTLGVNAGIKKYFSNDFYVDTGFHFGGGGGAGAPDGGGAFILPHLNLGYDLKYFSLNSGWSYVDFFDKGNISGHQINVGIEIPLDYSYAENNHAEKEFSFKHLKNSDWNKPTSKTSLLLHANNLIITNHNEIPGTPKLEGKTIRLAGFEFGHYLSENWLAFLKVDGAYSGIRAGYMDVFFGAAYDLSFNKNRTHFISKFGIGAGGGGGVNSRGGFMIYPDFSLDQKLFKSTFISLNKGWVLSPDSFFASSSYGIGLKYYIERNGIISEKMSSNTSKFKGLDIILKHDLYLNAKRMENPTENLHQISLQINLDLNKHIYLAGQTSFANFGNAGAYAEGVVGIGIKSNRFLSDTTSFFTQFLTGGAGGGNISTGEGLIIKPSIGFNYKLSNLLNFRASSGYIKAKGGNLGSVLFNFGIKYNISFLKLK